MPWGRIFGDFPKLFRQESVGYLQTFVGRPGLDPGTLGIEPDHPTATVAVRITWSEKSPSPLTSAEILSNLIPWLQDWLHCLGNDIRGDVKISGSNGNEIEVRVKIENP
jgi:hypothetical protein